MTIIFCSDCGYRCYTVSKAISHESCGNCGAQGTMKELRLNPVSTKREVGMMKA